MLGCFAVLASFVSCKGKYTNAEPPPPVMFNKTVFQEDVDYTVAPVSATKIQIVVTENNLGSYSLPLSGEEAYQIPVPQSEVLTTSASSSVTDATPKQLTTTKGRPFMTNQNNVQDFINLLAEKIKENCDYDEFSPISKICPSWEKTVMEESYDPATKLLNQKVYDRMMGWTFQDIERFIIDNQTIEKLKTSCSPGQWCLSYGNSNKESHLEERFVSKHLKHICLVASCFSYLNSYFDRCVQSTISHDILSLVPSVCDITKNVSSSYCFERSLRLIHVGYLAEKSNFSMANVISLKLAIAFI